MKKLLIVSEGRNTGQRLLEQLKQLMSRYIEIENVLLSELQTKNIEADLIVYTSSYVCKRGLRYIDSRIPYIVAKRVIDHKNIKELISIQEGKDVLFINDGYDSTMEAINQIIDLGLDHIKYHPYYPDCTSYPQLEIAITPGESQLTPYKPKKLIDIGSRILDIKSIHDIGTLMDINDHLTDSLVTNYIRDIVEISRSIEESRRTSIETQQILEMIINSLDYGIAFVNLNGNILTLNSKFEYIFGIKKKDLYERNLQDILPIRIILKNNNSYMTQIENKEVSIEVSEVNFSKIIGYIISIKHVNKLTKQGVKSTNCRYINRKLHDFSDYYTINKEVQELIKRAKRFAKTDGTILISGENGTGKEILAQGIHMNSYRRDKAFVPINIATISSNLVESELFGYEEGTFTGAIKGGKMGIFEIADGGTIFIDEIGDTPLDVQAALLRVLEEKRIRRVGGSDELPVDVRIIAATNKNLLRLVNENKFRLDLFFRLNILPLETIPLRRRTEDIEYLLKYFVNINLKHKKISNLEEFFEPDTIEFLKHYEWKGNVRELINLVQYLVLVYEDEKIGLNLLHRYMFEESSERKSTILSVNEIWILKQLLTSYKIPIGRTKLSRLSDLEKQNIGEGKIRSLLKELEEKGLAESIDNRGFVITDKGSRILREYI